MTDREVGAIWTLVRSDRLCQTTGDGDCSQAYNCLHDPQALTIQALIRMLVKERNMRNDNWRQTFAQFGLPIDTLDTFFHE